MTLKKSITYLSLLSSRINLRISWKDDRVTVPAGTGLLGSTKPVPPVRLIPFAPLFHECSLR